MQFESDDYRVLVLNCYSEPAKRIICEVSLNLWTFYFCTEVHRTYMMFVIVNPSQLNVLHLVCMKCFFLCCVQWFLLVSVVLFRMCLFFYGML